MLLHEVVNHFRGFQSATLNQGLKRVSFVMRKLLCGRGCLLIPIHAGKGFEGFDPGSIVTSTGYPRQDPLGFLASHQAIVAGACFSVGISQQLLDGCALVCPATVLSDGFRATTVASKSSGVAGGQTFTLTDCKA